MGSHAHDSGRKYAIQRYRHAAYSGPCKANHQPMVSAVMTMRVRITVLCRRDALARRFLARPALEHPDCPQREGVIGASAAVFVEQPAHAIGGDQDADT